MTQGRYHGASGFPFQRLLFLAIPLIAFLAIFASTVGKVMADAPEQREETMGDSRASPSASPRFGLPSAPTESNNLLRQGEATTTISPLKVIQSLGICIGALFVGYALLRRKGLVKTIGNGDLELVGRIALSPKTTLVSVRHQGQNFLVTVGEERVTLLPSFPAGELFAEDALALEASARRETAANS